MNKVTLAQLFEALKYVIGVLTLFGITIEILPIKISPLKWLGKKLNADTNKRLNDIQEHVHKLETEVNTNEIDRIKYEILQFSGSLRNGLKRSEIDYMHIEMIFKKYESKGGNSYITHEMEYIRECHDKGMIL